MRNFDSSFMEELLISKVLEFIHLPYKPISHTSPLVGSTAKTMELKKITYMEIQTFQFLKRGILSLILPIIFIRLFLLIHQIMQWLKWTITLHCGSGSIDRSMTNLQ